MVPIVPSIVHFQIGSGISLAGGVFLPILISRVGHVAPSGGGLGAVVSGRSPSVEFGAAAERVIFKGLRIRAGAGLAEELTAGIIIISGNTSRGSFRQGGYLAGPEVIPGVLNVGGSAERQAGSVRRLRQVARERLSRPWIQSHHRPPWQGFK